MKSITVSVDDELYHEARTEAARQRKSLSALVRECLSGLRQSSSHKCQAKDPKLGERKAALKALWARLDATPELPGSVGPLNREELYQRGISRY